jgi:predicted secreted Zn-dependent protease
VPDARVELEIEIVMPRWDPPPDADAALVARWTRFVESTMEHAVGHRAYAIRSEALILDAIDAAGGTVRRAVLWEPQRERNRTS